MISRTLTHLIRPCRLITTTPAMMEEVNIKAPSTLDTEVIAPISIEDPGATTKDIHAKMGSLRTLWEAETATVMPIRRSINPRMMPASSSTLISTHEVASRTVGLRGLRQRWNVGGSLMKSMEHLLHPEHHSSLPSLALDSDPSQQGSKPSDGLRASRSLESTPTTARQTPPSG